MRGAAWLLVAAAAACTGEPAPPAPSPSAPPPRRICSVNLAADEILIELVDPSRIVAVSAYADNAGLSNAAGRYPASLPRVTANVEAIVALAPDLVCVNPYNSADFVRQVEEAKIPVFRFGDLGSFAAIREGVLALGRRVGAEERAREIAASMDARLAALARLVEGAARRPRVYYWSGGWTAGGGTVIGEMIERAGGVNLAAAAGRRGMAQVPVERILADDPDALLLDDRQWVEGVPDLEGLPAQFGALRAVREGKVVRLRANLVSPLSHFVVDGAEALARELHAEIFAAPPGSGR